MARNVPNWYQCPGCGSEFCVGEENKVTVRSEPVRHCPFCGNGGVYVPTVYSNPPMPNRWR